jgi:hypothetical protein
MDHFVGLDVSVKETSICIVDETGKIVREVKVASEPDASPRTPSSSSRRSGTARRRARSASAQIAGGVVAILAKLKRPSFLPAADLFTGAIENASPIGSLVL